uniref:Septin-type G domain-containing protein n=1 Tax=Ganoderma boninense TaxID=34458 RepID=A0A5K1K4X7_9APHY|nr:Septin-type G domain-containing protein [Ganoderma boninense]
MASSSSTLPADFILDVHDLAVIILDTHSRTESLFPQAQLVEINRGITTPTTLPAHVFPPEWHNTANGQKRLAYILKNDSAATERVSIDTFAHPDGVKVPAGRELTRRDLEDVFWRCKTFNNGYALAYVAQHVFDRLPPTAKLRARTSAKHEVVCKPSDVAVAEIVIVPKEACLMIQYEPRSDLGPNYIDETEHLSGFDGPGMPWVYLFIGEPRSVEDDPRVALDLVTSQIGGRGAGGEIFSLERGVDYHSKVLSKVARELEPYKLSGKLQLSSGPDALRTHADTLVELVLERLAKVANGADNFCRYCGKDGVEQRCSKCKTAYFCTSCHLLGWKYHKVWCT